MIHDPKQLEMPEATDIQERRRCLACHIDYPKTDQYFSHGDFKWAQNCRTCVVPKPATKIVIQTEIVYQSTPDLLKYLDLLLKERAAMEQERDDMNFKHQVLAQDVEHLTAQRTEHLNAIDAKDQTIKHLENEKAMLDSELEQFLNPDTLPDHMKADRDRLLLQFPDGIAHRG